MTTNPHNPMLSGPDSGSAEETLRLIARLPAPAGLEERVHAALQAAPRRGRVLAWPAVLQPQSAWMRAAAAAAIVVVVAGGGWGVYTHVRPAVAAHSIVLPVRGPAAGGFSSAGAMRTPQTIDGPVVAQPAKAQPVKAVAGKKAGERVVPAKNRKSRLQTEQKTALQPDQPATR